MQLVIVESPTKARKLKGFLGSDFKVEASVGHVRDLPKKTLGIDLEKNFEPVYEVSVDKKKVVKQLQLLAKDATKIYLAMDPDREGEAIAWHVQFLIDEAESKSSKSKKTTGTAESASRFVRATFHEITKTAVLAAIDHPTTLNIDLVNAQQARRILDRLVGYQVSPVLWKKVRRGLSAGRVQSVALRLIAEREREIEAFKAEEYWEVGVLVAPLGSAVVSRPVYLEGKLPEVLPENYFQINLEKVDEKKFAADTKEKVTPLIADLELAAYQILSVETKARSRQSLPPFSTSTLQQSAANKFGFSAKQTMALAQQLYEEGLITYHRTDSVNLATSAVDMARAYILDRYGKEYLPDQPRYFANKSKNAQEAHEAIRVTDVQLTGESILQKASQLTDRHSKLYDLIWRRFLACQMASAVTDQTAMLVAAKREHTYQLRATGSILRFPGWTTLFPGGEDQLLPQLTEKQQLQFGDINPQQKFTQPPPRYNDASLVKELEKRGIGRPSTYASIISVIVDRGYVERTDKKFWATQIGLVVSDFLIKYFPEFMSYDFTAEMEEDLDRIARGEKEWRSVVQTFYTPLAAKIASVVESAERSQIPVEKTGEICPLCGETEHGEIVIRSGRFGKFKSCSRFPECKYTQNLIETLPDVTCPLCAEGQVVVKKTRWGKPFFGCGRYPECTWASWQKPIAGLRITPEQWAISQAERAERIAKRQATMAKTAPAVKKPTKKATRKKSTAKPKSTVKPKKPAAATRRKATVQK